MKKSISIVIVALFFMGLNCSTSGKYLTMKQDENKKWPPEFANEIGFFTDYCILMSKEKYINFTGSYLKRFVKPELWEKFNKRFPPEDNRYIIYNLILKKELPKGLNSWGFSPVKLKLSGLSGKNIDLSKIKPTFTEMWGDMFDWMLPPHGSTALYQYIYLFRLKEPYNGKEGESIALMVQHRVRKHTLTFSAPGGIK